jgi:hypothetical protein
LWWKACRWWNEAGAYWWWNVALAYWCCNETTTWPIHHWKAWHIPDWEIDATALRKWPRYWKLHTTTHLN